MARTSGEGPGDSRVRAFANPAAANHSEISSNEYVSPLSVLTSIFTAKNSPFTGPGSVGIHKEFRNGDRSSRCEGPKGFSDKRLTAFSSFAMEDMTQRRHGVAAAEIRLKDVAFHERESLSQTKLGRRFASDRNYFRPIHSRDANLIRALR